LGALARLGGKVEGLVAVDGTHPTGHLSDGCRLSYMAAGIASQGLGGPGVLELEVVLYIDTCICSCTYICA